MHEPMTHKIFVTLAVLASLFMTGCGSKDTTTQATSATTTTASAEAAAEVATNEPDAKTSPPSEPGYTVDDYVKDNGITETAIPPGATDAPQLTVPVPAGWIELPRDKPSDPWGSLILDGSAEPFATGIIVEYDKFTGPVDPATILELAPNSIQELPDYEGPETGEPSQVSGFDAVDIAGPSSYESKPAYSSLTTVVVPGEGGLYVLTLSALGPADQEAAITQAMSAMGSDIKIQA